jgi:hypothetical protein
MRTNTVSACIVAALSLQAVSSAQAQNWEFDPRLQLGYEFNDNYRLDIPGNEIEVSGGALDASLPFSLLSPIRKIEISPRVRATYFPDEPEQDSTDYFLGAVLEQRTERQLFGFKGNWSRQDVVRSELPGTEIDSGLGEPTIGDAGQVSVRNKRDSILAEPYWHFDLDQRNRVEAGAYYVDADFENNPADVPPRFRQLDFSDTGAYVGWGYALSQRSRLTFRGRASRYETTLEADAYGGEVEWRSNYTQTSNLYVRVGAQQTELSTAGSSAETNIIAGVGGQWKWPTTNLFADLTRSVGPNATGAVIERSELRLRMSRAIRPRFSILAGARATSDATIGDIVYPERDYLTGEVGFDWRLTRSWSLVGEYQYIWQEYSDDPSDTSSNSIILGIVYEPGRGE